MALMALLLVGALAQHGSEWTYSGKPPTPGAAGCPSEGHGEARLTTHNCVPALGWGLPVAGGTSRVCRRHTEPKPRLRKRGTGCARIPDSPVALLL